MFLSAHWCSGGLGPSAAVRGRPLRFPRDKYQFVSKKTRMVRPPAILVAAALSLSSAFAASQPPANVVATPVQDFPDRVIISVRDQKLMVVHNNERVAIYPVSTSKYGLGDY